MPAQDLTITVSPSAARIAGQQVTVTASANLAILTPLMSAMVGPTMTLSGQGTMRVETNSL